jgi:hypothetical protein
MVVSEALEFLRRRSPSRTSKSYEKSLALSVDGKQPGAVSDATDG